MVWFSLVVVLDCILVLWDVVELRVVGGWFDLSGESCLF